MRGKPTQIREEAKNKPAAIGENVLLPTDEIGMENKYLYIISPR